MDGYARSRSSNQVQASLDAGHALVAETPADRVAGHETDAVARVTWLSARPEYWPPHSGNEAQVWGVACLLFGIGEGGARWLARLARSDWFAGLEPRAEDLAVAGGLARGDWAGEASGDEGHLAAAAEAFFASAPLPSAWYAAVAVPCGAGPAERSAAIGLVGALTKRRDPLGRPITVVVTAEAVPGAAQDAAFTRRLLDRGAFVVRGGADPGAIGGDHLHHFSLRAVMIPRRGRLVCVDLADYLLTWRPGRAADLHVVPFARGDAERALRGLPLLDQDSGGVRALNLGFHLDPRAPGVSLVEIDRFVTRCCELLQVPDGNAVFTDTDRLDGAGGSVDLLVVRDGAAAGG